MVRKHIQIAISLPVKNNQIQMKTTLIEFIFKTTTFEATSTLVLSGLTGRTDHRRPD